MRRSFTQRYLRPSSPLGTDRCRTLRVCDGWANMNGGSTMQRDIGLGCMRTRLFVSTHSGGFPSADSADNAWSTARTSPTTSLKSKLSGWWLKVCTFR